MNKAEVKAEINAALRSMADRFARENQVQIVILACDTRDSYRLQFSVSGVAPDELPVMLMDAASRLAIHQEQGGQATPLGKEVES